MSTAGCTCNLAVLKHLKLMLVFIRPAQGLENDL
jgi:hypothetical protein